MLREEIPMWIWKAAAGDGTHLLDFRVCTKRLGVSYIRKKEGFRVDSDPLIEIGQSRKNMLGSPINKMETFCRCLGMIRTRR